MLSVSFYLRTSTKLRPPPKVDVRPRSPHLTVLSADLLTIQHPPQPRIGQVAQAIPQQVET